MSDSTRPQSHSASRAVPPPRQYSGQDTNTFDSSANPDEDWIKISDLAERRRIQNRIAQRNYRQKLKRRLEDLERRAGSSDDVDFKKPSQTFSGTAISQYITPPMDGDIDISSKTVPSQYLITPPLDDNDLFSHTLYDQRGAFYSPRPSPFLNSSNPEEFLLFPDDHNQPYGPYPTEIEPSHLATFTAPTKHPSMIPSSETIKRESNPHTLLVREADEPEFTTAPMRTGDLHGKACLAALNQVAQPDQGQSLVVDHAPFTDSGYASAPNPDLVAKAREVLNKQDDTIFLPKPDTSEDDAKTTYSAATTVIPTFTEQSISDVCRDIFAKIGHSVSDERWSLMSKTFPGLIKAFAIKLGTGATDDLSRRIMHFVHKNHQEIALQLQVMFHHVNDDVAEVRTHAADIMSLHDKMSLWGRKSNDNVPEVDASALFEGVEENEDDDIGPDLLAYSKAIISSPAYSWLIDSLLKESQFHWDELEPRAMVDQVRLPIVARLPKNRISKRKDLDTHTVTFQLPWRPLEIRIKEELRRRNTPKASICSLVVLTSSSSDQVQATTVRQYLDQTWVGGGTELLDAVQAAVDGSHEHVPYDKEPRRTRITSTKDGDFLAVTINGSTHTISECGEQLSWLGAALQPSCTDSVVHSTPYVLSDAGDSSSKRPFDQKLQIGFENHSRESLMPSLHLEGEVAQSVIVRGFPTRRRPDLCSGIEVSPETLFDFVGAPNLTVGGQSLLLQGSRYSLGLVIHTEDVLVWHILNSPAGLILCTGHHSLVKADEVLPSVNLVDLWRFRHILQPCTDLGIPLDKQVSDVTHSCAGEASESPVPTPGSSTSRSAVLTGTQDTSLDSDMLSLSDTSDDTSINPPGHRTTLNPSIDIVVHRLLSKYREETVSRPAVPQTCTWEESGTLSRPVDDQHGSSSSGGSLNTTNATTVSVQTNHRSPSKRNLPGSDGDENDGDDQFLRPPKRARPDQAERDILSLACPFWKQNPSKHRNCFKAKLGKISYVKQHIARKHTPAFYCERCLVVFPDKQSHVGHIRHGQCTWDPTSKLDGISHEQHRELSRKSKANLSESENWFHIWGIVFPDHPPPASAYMNPELSEDLCRFREFSQRHASDTLVEELRTSGIFFSNEDIASSLHEILNRGLNRLYQEWLSSTTPSARSASPNPGWAQPTQQNTPVSSLADSGVVVGGQGLSRELGGSSSSGSGNMYTIQQYDMLDQTQQRPTTVENGTTIIPIPDNNHQVEIDESFGKTTRNEEDGLGDAEYGVSASTFDHYTDFDFGFHNDIGLDFVYNPT